MLPSILQKLIHRDANHTFVDEGHLIPVSSLVTWELHVVWLSDFTIITRLLLTQRHESLDLQQGKTVTVGILSLIYWFHLCCLREACCRKHSQSCLQSLQQN